MLTFKLLYFALSFVLISLCCREGIESLMKIVLRLYRDEAAGSFCRLRAHTEEE